MVTAKGRAKVMDFGLASFGRIVVNQEPDNVGDDRLHVAGAGPGRGPGPAHRHLVLGVALDAGAFRQAFSSRVTTTRP